MNSLNKTIVITGVTGGVGRALAMRFSNLGWNVIGLARNQEKLQKLADSIDKNFMFAEVDVMDQEKRNASL